MSKIQNLPPRKGVIGRRPAEIDEKNVELLARAGCSDHTIAHSLGIGETTIKRRFGPRIKKWRETAISDAKLKLFERAMSDTRKDSTTALIFWLKNYGGMSDKLAVDAPESISTPPQIEVVLVAATKGELESNGPPILDATP